MVRAFFGSSIVLLLLVLGANAQPGLSATDKSSCAPVVNGLNFICGMADPEDLEPIPGSHWLIASGYDPGGGLLAGSGLKLVNTDAKTFQDFYAGAADQKRPDRRHFPLCSDPPDPQRLVTHGLYLHASPNKSRYLLYVVAHNPREAIEIFTIDSSGAIPALAWNGCVPMPPGLKANSVAAFADGTIVATVLGTGKKTAAGLPAGVVLQWKPGDAGFLPIPGTELPSNNGLELSKDESEFYVVGFGDATVSVFSRNDPSKPLRSVKAPGFVPDNLRWSGDILIAAGPMYDEPACGGTRAQAAQALGAAGRKPGGGCNRGYMVAALDPVTMLWKVLAYAEPNPQIGIIATGVVVDGTLWIGAALTPGLAFRALPGPKGLAVSP